MSDGWEDIHEDGWVDEEKPGYTESALRSVAQGATFGLADELSGAGNAVFDAIKKRSLGDVKSDYIANRDNYRRADRLAQEANPITYGTGQVLGGLGSAIAVPGVAAGELGGALAAGALQGYGSSEAEAPEDQVKDIGIGGALGGVGYGAGKLAAKAIPSAETALNYARKKTIDHLRPTPKVARALGPERLSEIADQTLSSGAMKPFSRVGDTAERLAAQRERVGKEIGQYIEEATASGRTMSPTEIAKRFEAEVIDPLRSTAENRNLVANLEKQRDTFLEHYTTPEGGATPLSPSQIEAEKRAVQNNINYLTDAKPALEARQGYAGVLKNAGEETVANPGFNEAKEEFGKIADAQLMAERTAGLTEGTGLFGRLDDLSAGQMSMQALLHGEPTTSAAIAGGRALTRGRVASTLATGAKSLSENSDAIKSGVAQLGTAIGRKQIMDKVRSNPKTQRFAQVLDNAAKRGDDSLASTMYLLSQTEPDFGSVLTEPTH